MKIEDLKKSQLKETGLHKKHLMCNPSLSWLFFEITNKCNLSCKHCGSNCTSKGELLTIDDVRATLETLKNKIELPMICITGGEPLLHPDFFEIAECVHSMGFDWGMTTNATLIDDSVAQRLRDVGMATVSVSLDGLEASHDKLRQQKGSWQKAINGLKALQKAGFKPQVTTVISTENFNELDDIYSLLCDINITDWRPINIEPIGRACEAGELLLSHEQFSSLIAYIQDKRFDVNCKMHVTFGCSHYLGTKYEFMVRDHYFMCTAGTATASIRSNGDICACLDIDNRPELVQGNIRKDNFLDVWKNEFKIFRNDRTDTCKKCLNCPDKFICGGDSAHTWDYKNNEPLLCYKDYGEALNKQNNDRINNLRNKQKIK